MPTPLVPVQIPSIYNGADLPARMAHATPDFKAAVGRLATSLAAAGGALVLSDMFRSYDMQKQAHEDFVSGRKSANSPAPGGSFHEAGRALDLDLGKIKVTLAAFWTLAAHEGLVPIIATPNTHLKEAWHFERRGSHQLVYDYYHAGKGHNFTAPYTAAAASAIVAIGVGVDRFQAGQTAAYVQSALIRLGFDLGDLDGAMGPKSRAALTQAGFAGNDLAAASTFLDGKLKARFPEEF